MRLYSTLKNYIINFDNISKNGVYKIYHINKPDRLYIGSSFRKNNKQCKKGVYGRWIEHFSRLKYNKHHSPKLQNLINKYGIDGIRFEIIWYCDNNCSQETIRKKELEYISFYESHTKKGLNCKNETYMNYQTYDASIKSSERMRKYNPMFNKDTVEKMLNTMYEMEIYEPILLFTLDGKLVGEFKSTTYASKYLNRDSSNVIRAAKGEFKKSGNHIVIYKSDYNIDLLNNKIKLVNTYKKQSKEIIKKRTKKLMKKVRVFNDNFDKIYNSIKEAEYELNIPHGAISRCCKGEYKHTKGYKCEFINI